MRKLAAGLVLAMLSLPLFAQSDSKAALVRELVDLTHENDAAIEALLLTLGGTHAKVPELQRGIDGLAPADQQAVRTAASKVTAQILAAHLNESQLRSIIAFLKTDAGRAYCDALAALANERPVGIVLALERPDSSEARARRTMADIRSLATACEAFATDNNRYPDGMNVADLRPQISPTYIKVPRENDAWGTPFAYRVDKQHQTYRFISAGPDRKFDRTSLDINTPPAKSDDIVYQNGEFLQAPLK